MQIRVNITWCLKTCFQLTLAKKKVCNFPSAVLDEFEQSVVAWTGLRGRMKERSVCCMYTFTNFKPGLENPNQVGNSTSGFQLPADVSTTAIVS